MSGQWNINIANSLHSSGLLVMGAASFLLLAVEAVLLAKTILRTK